MNLDHVPGGSSIFIDANIFIYAVGQKSEQCRRLLRRCASHDVSGRTSTTVIAEVCHRRMLMEARSKGILPAKATPQDLAKKRMLLIRLTDYEQEVRDLLSGQVKVEPVHIEDFPVALVLQKQCGLLTNDSLNLAVAKRLGLTAIATSDADVAAAQDFVVYSPDDLPGSLS